MGGHACKAKKSVKNGEGVGTMKKDGGASYRGP